MSDQIINLLNDKQKVCFLVKNAINTVSCDDWLQLAKSQGFDDAIDKYPSTYRNNQRLQLDSEELARIIFDKCKDYLPKTLTLNSNHYELDSLNSRLRYCKYQTEQWFKIHQDGEYRPSSDKCSKLTFLLYLNDASEFEGGYTNFYADQFGHELLASYRPQKGDLLIFSHDIWHSGETVEHGTKYILRSDVIYKTDSKKERTNTHHNGYIWKIHALDTNRFVTVSRDKSIKIWDKKLTCLQSLATHENSVLDIAHDKDKNLYGVSRDGYISQWGVNNGSYDLNYKIDSGHPTVLSVNVFDNVCVTTGSDGKIRKFDLTGKLLCESKEQCDWHWRLLKFGDNYISCNTDGQLYFWDVATLELKRKIGISTDALTCITVYKKILYVGTISGKLIKFDLQNNTVVNATCVHAAAVRDVKVSDNERLYTCGEDNLVKSFSALELDLGAETIASHAGFATSLLLAENEIYSVSYDGMIISSQL